MSGIKRDALDGLFSDCVRTRANWCEAADVHIGYKGESTTCAAQLECAHIHSRRHQYLRHDPQNAITLCTSHHMWFTANPTLFTAWLSQYEPVGENALEMLVEKLRIKHKWLKGMKKEARAHYRQELINLKQARDQGANGRVEFVGFL